MQYSNICLSFRPMPSSEPSLFVTLAAQAMSSVGFSVSIIAWLWLTFVPPAPVDPPEPVLLERKAVLKKRRRRSAPATLQTRKRDSLSPSFKSSDTPSSPPRTRRVYFLDSPISSRPTIEPSPHDSPISFEQPLSSSSICQVSPSSSSSTLAHTISAIPPQLATWHESAIESDSTNNGSPRTSLSSTTRPALQERTRRFSGPDSVTDVTGADHKRRSSIGFTAPWRRASGSKNPASSGPSSSSSVPAPSYFSRKSTRRASTPVPRTQPYAYPYYAQPPIDDEQYVAHLRSLPQFGGGAGSPTASEDSERDGEAALLNNNRGRIRMANDGAQAALGHGRRPPVQRPQQRSASESWAAGQELRL